MIGLHDKIRVGFKPLAPLKGASGTWACGEQEVPGREKGLLVMGAGGMPPNLVHRLLKKMGQHQLDVKIRSDGPWRSPVAVLSLGHPLLDPGGRHTTRITQTYGGMSNEPQCA